MNCDDSSKRASNTLPPAPSTAAGWYPDLTDRRVVRRYWDGQQWTAAVARIGWRFVVFCALLASGLMIAIGTWQSYMVTRTKSNTFEVGPTGELKPKPVVRELSGWDYVSGSDDARIFYGFISWFVGIMIAFLALIALIRLLLHAGQWALTIACAGLAGLSILVTLVDLNLILDYRAGKSWGRDYSVGWGLYVVLVGALTALVLSIALSIGSRSRTADGPP